MTQDTRDEMIRQLALYDQHATLIGRVNMSWNDAHTEVFQLFRMLSGMAWAQADAVFFSIRTDSAQRDMTAALANVVLKDDPDVLKSALGYLNTLGKLAAQRNLAIHTAWFIDEGSGQPSSYIRLNPPKSLEPDVIAQFSRLHEKLSGLFIEMHAFRKTHAASLRKGQSPMRERLANPLAIALQSATQNSEPPPQS